MSNLSPKRTGLVTSSQISLILGKGAKDKPIAQTGLSYLYRKAAERLTGLNTDIKPNASMLWGIEHEVEAVNMFIIEESPTSVTKTGDNQEFVIHQSGLYGGTPDSLVLTSDFNSTGAEIKCPNSDTHLKYRAISDAAGLKKENADYYWQVQSLIECTGSEFWYFVSYDPRMLKHEFQYHCVKIERVQKDIDFMMERVVMANEIIERIVQSGKVC